MYPAYRATLLFFSLARRDLRMVFTFYCDTCCQNLTQNGSTLRARKAGSRAENLPLSFVSAPVSSHHLMKRMQCPDCKSTGGLRKVIYGLPDGPIDESKFNMGGCCISERDATKTQAKRDVISYIEGFYNSRRRHFALNYRRPNEVHYSYQAPSLAA